MFRFFWGQSPARQNRSEILDETPGFWMLFCSKPVEKNMSFILQGSLVMGPILVGSKLMQMYGNL